ncbi:MAG: hypothetical protein H7A45_15565 [Verrucomicrobiales bacterium]|nr:hypothetical protein [Verrucomicrobiales bacterium]
MANPNSSTVRFRQGTSRRRRHAGVWATILGAVLALTPARIRAADAVREAAEARARAACEVGRKACAAAPTDPVAAWEFARATFDWAEFATAKEDRARLATEGIAAGRRAVELGPALAASHYYLAMNLGQLARTKLLGALSLVTEMEDLFIQARSLDPRFDFAGADRCLGLLYRDAPGWPVSVGNRKKARKHLEAAINLAPDYVENRLNLLEALVEWGERAEAREVRAALAGRLPLAREEFAGERWAWSWQDWDRRWESVTRQIDAW